MSDFKRVAIPSMGSGGLDAERSGHFGHCDCFTLVDVAETGVLSISLLANPPHAEGGCLAPVSMLASEGVDSIVVAGMGMRPLMGFADAGIRVFFENVTPHVSGVVDMLLAGELPEMEPGSACSGGCSH